MAYTKLDSTESIADLISRKEFYQLRKDTQREIDAIDQPEIDQMIARGKFLPKSHQILIGTMISPDTPYMRIHCAMQTGVGKTQAALQPAWKFIATYKKIYQIMSSKVSSGRAGAIELDRGTPSVFILGFGGTRTAFLRDLIMTPDYGFCNAEEREELNRRRAVSSQSPDQFKAYKDYYSFIKKRVTNKARSGFFKFYGYDEFILRLFKTDIPLITIEDEIMARRDEATPEEIFDEYIDSGKIIVNESLLATFQNSLLICDEIHNTYNMNMKNNRGLAIQYLLDHVPTLRFISLSATALNNSPTEIVEIINYLVPRTDRITKRDLFLNSRDLKPGALETIGRLLRDKVSFVQDANIKYYPERVFLGKEITLPHAVESLPAGATVPYLKFIECPMSDYHWDACVWLENNYEKLIRQTRETPIVDSLVPEHDEEQKSADLSSSDPTDEEYSDIEEELEEGLDKTKAGAAQGEKPPGEKPSGEKPSGEKPPGGNPVIMPREDIITPDENTKVPTDSYTIYDMVYPGVTNGIFRSGDIRAISGYDLPTRDKLGVSVKRSFGTNIITGEFMTLGRLEQYSTKYATLIKHMHEDLKYAAGDQTRAKKIFVFHERVQMSGVLAIEQILLRNGFIDEASEPSDNTLCSFCGRRMDEHSADINEVPAGITPHHYNPSRYFIMHSMIKKSVMDQNRERFNQAENRNGKNAQIILGSRLIKESYEFKACQKAYIASLPTNISTLLQVIGRFNRNLSHSDLPPEQRRVEISILVSTAPERMRIISLELYRYIYKLLDYRIIQEIEREINRNAFDADIHRGINMSADIRKLYFQGDNTATGNLITGNSIVGNPATGSTPKEILGNLYFEPAVVAHANGALDTFRAYKYVEDEIRNVVYVIKRLFLTRDVYTYDELLNAVRRNPFMTEINPNLISEDSFIIALNHLVSNVGEMIADSNVNFVDRLFDYNSKYIWDLSGRKNKIEQIGQFYIMFPVVTIPDMPLERTYVHTIEYVRDRERAIIKKFVSENNKIDIDAHTYLRPRPERKQININVNDYIKRQFEATNYEIMRAEFLGAPPQNLQSLIWAYTDKFQMGLLADAIESVVSTNVIGHELAHAIIDVFAKFDAVIYCGEVKKYKDVLKGFHRELTLPDNMPLGFAAPTGCKLFDPDEKIWFEVSKLAMNRHITYKENEIVIGQFETVDNQQRFKLRRPIQVIQKNIRAMSQSAEGNIDTRLLERGIVCETKSKQELLQICTSLGISLTKHKHDLRIKTVCSLVRDNLIASEQRARRKRDRHAYIYSWWSEIPRIL